MWYYFVVLMSSIVVKLYWLVTSIFKLDNTCYRLLHLFLIDCARVSLRSLILFGYSTHCLEVLGYSHIFYYMVLERNFGEDVCTMLSIFIFCCYLFFCLSTQSMKLRWAFFFLLLILLQSNPLAFWALSLFSSSRPVHVEPPRSLLAGKIKW